MSQIDKITIVYGLPDTNTGGIALGLALSKVLNTRFPGVQINYMSTHHSKWAVDRAYPILPTLTENLEVIPFPYLLRADNGRVKSKPLRYLLNMCWVLTSLLSRVFLWFPWLGVFNASLREIRSSQMVIGRGTNIFYDKPRRNPMRRLQEYLAKYDLCFPLLYASRVKVSFAIYAQSFGPIHNDLNVRLLRKTFNKGLILTRDRISHQFLLDRLQVESKRIHCVPDSVFALEAPDPSRVKQICDSFQLPMNRYAVFVLRANMDSKDVLDAFLDVCADINEYLLAQGYVDETVIVTQCHHLLEYDLFESDQAISHRLHDRLKGRCRLIEQLMTPEELMSVIAGSWSVFTTRLHSAIFSFISGTIPFGFYSSKTRGIFEVMGWDAFYFDAPFEGKRVKKQIDVLFSDYDAHLSLVRERAQEIHKQALETPSLLAKMDSTNP